MVNSTQHTSAYQVPSTSNVSDAANGSVYFDIMDGVHCRFLGRSTVKDKYRFEAVSRRYLDSASLQEIQARLGYHPNGYGSPVEVVSERYRNFYVTRWKVWSSCD